MITIYPSIIVKEPGCYSVSFPDLNDITTEGKSLNEAIEMAIDLLAGYMVGLKEDGEPIPSPTDINKINLDKYEKQLKKDGIEYSECFKQLISVDVNAYAREHFDKPVRKSVLISSFQNSEAIKYRINFSETLREALDIKIAEKRKIAIGK